MAAGSCASGPASAPATCCRSAAVWAGVVPAICVGSAVTVSVCTVIARIVPSAVVIVPRSAGTEMLCSRWRSAAPGTRAPSRPCSWTSLPAISDSANPAHSRPTRSRRAGAGRAGCRRGAGRRPRAPGAACRAGPPVPSGRRASPPAGRAVLPSRAPAASRPRAARGGPAARACLPGPAPPGRAPRPGPGARRAARRRPAAPPAAPGRLAGSRAGPALGRSGFTPGPARGRSRPRPPWRGASLAPGPGPRARGPGSRARRPPGRGPAPRAGAPRHPAAPALRPSPPAGVTVCTRAGRPSPRARGSGWRSILPFLRSRKCSRPGSCMPRLAGLPRQHRRRLLLGDPRLELLGLLGQRGVPLLQLR